MRRQNRVRHASFKGGRTTRVERKGPSKKKTREGKKKKSPGFVGGAWCSKGGTEKLPAREGKSARGGGGGKTCKTDLTLKTKDFGIHRK